MSLGRRSHFSFSLATCIISSTTANGAGGKASLLTSDKRPKGKHETLLSVNIVKLKTTLEIMKMKTFFASSSSSARLCDKLFSSPFFFSMNLQLYFTLHDVN